MTLLLQLSDPHFGTERAAVAEALRSLVRSHRPQVLLLSGDITQRATAAQFAAARAFVDALQVPVCLAIPGNHDIALFDLASRLLRPYARFARAFGGELEPQFENHDVLVLALNTTRRWRHVNGELGAAQIERVARRFEAAPAAQWRVVVVHQPIAVPDAVDVYNLLRGHQQARRRWAAAGADLVAGGHIHLPYVLALPEGSAARPLWAVQAGTALSTRVRGGVDNSVNLIHLHAADHGNARHGRVERWDFDAATQRFVCVSVQPLEAAGGP